MNSALDHPWREGGFCGVWHIPPGFLGCRQPLHHTLGRGQVFARGEPGAGVSAFTARCVLFVCLLRAGSSLFTGESHPETQALFLSGLSQVEESIKPPDRGKGRHSGVQSENHQLPGARPRPLQQRTVRLPPGPAAPPGHAYALAELLLLLLAAPACCPGHLQERR